MWSFLMASFLVLALSACSWSHGGYGDHNGAYYYVYSNRLSVQDLVAIYSALETIRVADWQHVIPRLSDSAEGGVRFGQVYFQQEGYSAEQWKLIRFLQIHSETTISESTIEFFGNLEGVGHYELEYSSRSYTREGFEYRHDIPLLPQLRVQPNLRFWAIRQYTSNSLIGEGVLSINRPPKISIQMLNLSSHEHIFRSDSYYGWGYSIGGAVIWQHSFGVEKSVGVRSLVDRDFHRSIGVRQTNMQSERVSLDEDNRINYAPLIRGSLRYHNITLAEQMRLYLSSTIRRGRWVYQSHIERGGDEYQEGIRFRVTYQGTNRDYSVGFRQGGQSISLGTKSAGFSGEVYISSALPWLGESIGFSLQRVFIF